MKSIKLSKLIGITLLGVSFVFTPQVSINLMPTTYASYQTWQGYCARQTNAFTNSSLTRRNGVEYVGGGDTVTVLGEEGNAYYVRYPLTRGGYKDCWVPKSSIARVGGGASNNPVIQPVVRTYQQWKGYCARQTTAFTNAELTQRNGVEYVGAGDTVTVLNESGNAYYVSYPLTRGGTKERWVPKSAISSLNNGMANAAASVAATAVKQATQVAKSYQSWSGYCANKATAYMNSALTQRNGVEYVGAGDTVTVLNEEGNAYYVEYPLTRGGTKKRWVAKSAITNNSASSSRTVPTSATNPIIKPVAREYQSWSGYCANKATAYMNSALTQRNGVEYVGAGDTVTVLNEEGNAYYVEYPLTRGGTKKRWVAKSAVSRQDSNIGSSVVGGATQGISRVINQPTQTYQSWSGYCARKATAYMNSALTQRNGVEYVGAGDTVTVLNEEGNAYYVEYPLTRGGTKKRWVAKSAVARASSNVNPSPSPIPTPDINNSGIRETLMNVIYGQNGGRLLCDFDGYSPNGTYGRKGYRHEGIDVSLYDGAPVYAVTSGIIKKNGGDRYNTFSIQDDKTGKMIVYLHMQSPQKHSIGSRIEKGTLIGYQGSAGTGSSHVHIEITEGKNGPAEVSMDKILKNKNPYDYWRKILY